MAFGANLLEAYDRAYSTGPASAYGGIIAFNGEPNGETAQSIGVGAGQMSRINCTNVHNNPAVPGFLFIALRERSAPLRGRAQGSESASPTPTPTTATSPFS